MRSRESTPPEETCDGRTSVVLAAAGILAGLGLVLAGLLSPP